MTIRQVVVANPPRANRAMLAPATRKDSYRIGATWQGVGNYETWEYNKTVEEIRQFPKNGYAVGDTIEIYDFTNRHSATMTLEEIRMINCAEIHDEDLHLLGYRDRDEWLDQTEGGLGQRKAWLLIGHIDQHGPKNQGAEVGTLKTTNVDTGETETIIVDLRDHGVQ